MSLLRTILDSNARGAASILGAAGIATMVFLGAVRPATANQIAGGSDYLTTLADTKFVNSSDDILFITGLPIDEANFGITDTIVKRTDYCIGVDYCTVDIEVKPLSFRGTAASPDFTTNPGITPSLRSMTIHENITFNSTLDVFDPLGNILSNEGLKVLSAIGEWNYFPAADSLIIPGNLGIAVDFKKHRSSHKKLQPLMLITWDLVFTVPERSKRELASLEFLHNRE